MSKKILIIEDESALSGALKITLEKLNYKIEIEGNGKQAVEHVKQFTPDLILLDIILPGETGWDIMKELKSISAETKPKLIVMSNLDTTTREGEAKELGADGYIIKSNTSLKEIVDKIQTILN